ncbi:MAG: AraC family transcriptional regulator [Planctomycetota bacterium]
MPRSPTTESPAFFSTAVVASRRFFLDLAPPADTKLAVVCGGFEQCAEDYAIARETFPYYSIELVVRGEGAVTIGGREYPLASGSLFTYGPGVAHQIQTTRRRPLHKFFVDFLGTEAAGLLDTSGVPAGACTRVSPVGDVQLLFNELLRDGQRGHKLAGRLCDSLLRCLGLRIEACRTQESAANSASAATFERCRKHIDQHAERLTSLRQVADECGVDPAYLSRLFQRHGQQPPYQYLLRVRMSIAADRLIGSTASVRSVAERLGYSDPFHFSRTFKSVFGISPSEFRRIR